MAERGPLVSLDRKAQELRRAGYVVRKATPLEQVAEAFREHLGKLAHKAAEPYTATVRLGPGQMEELTASWQLRVDVWNRDLERYAAAVRWFAPIPGVTLDPEAAAAACLPMIVQLLRGHGPRVEVGAVAPVLVQVDASGRLSTADAVAPGTLFQYTLDASNLLSHDRFMEELRRAGLVDQEYRLIAPPRIDYHDDTEEDP